MNATTPPYAGLTPDAVLHAVESAGLLADGRQLSLNSYENRVYQVGLEEGGAGPLGEARFVVAKFYRPGRWTDEQILEEHASNNTPGQPLTGNEFGQWSDQLRDVEEMLDDPELRNRVAQVRDRARAIRSEFKRHGTEPQWDLVKSQLLGELQSLQQRIAEDLQKMKSDRAMVPIDREPVPEEFDSMVQR